MTKHSVVKNYYELDKIDQNHENIEDHLFKLRDVN